jgi:hypothetical protein
VTTEERRAIETLREGLKRLLAEELRAGESAQTAMPRAREDVAALGRIEDRLSETD